MAAGAEQPVRVAVRDADRVVRRLEGGDVGHDVPVAVRMDLDQRSLAECPKRLDRRVERVPAQAVRDEEVASFDGDVVRAGRAVTAGRRVRRQAVRDDRLDAVLQPRDAAGRAVALASSRPRTPRRGRFHPVRPPRRTGFRGCRMRVPEGCAARSSPVLRLPQGSRSRLLPVRRCATQARPKSSASFFIRSPSLWMKVIARTACGNEIEGYDGERGDRAPATSCSAWRFRTPPSSRSSTAPGGGDHFQVTVASPRFEGLSLVDQHRLVYDALAAPLSDGTIHELRIKTKGTA